MGDKEFIFEYVRSCTAGALGIRDCGPVWQLAALAALLVIAIATLVILKLRTTLRARSQ